MMIQTQSPYGAILESLVQYIFERNGKCYMVDSTGTKFQISQLTFNYLKEKGYKVK